MNCGTEFAIEAHRGKRICCSSPCQETRRQFLKLVERLGHEDERRMAKREIVRASRAKFAKLWGSTARKEKGKHNSSAFVIRTELFVAQDVLPKHQFYDVYLTREINAQFPFDILARHEGRKAAVEVTTKFRYDMDPRKWKLLNFLDLKFFICIVKPDLSWYMLKEVRAGDEGLSARGLFMQKVKGGEAFPN